MSAAASLSSAAADKALQKISRGPRRVRRLRRQLVRALIGTALVSLLIVGSLNLVAAWSLLNEGAEEQLVSVAQTRANSIDVGIERTLSRTSVLAADLAVVNALIEFEAAFTDVGNRPLNEAEAAELDAAYDGSLALLGAVGIDATAEELQPESDAGRYLQYHYSAPAVAGDSADVGITDESDYREVHDRFDPYLSGLAVGAIDDLMLISPAGDVVYSAGNRLDLGTNLRTGYGNDTNLADAVLEQLPRARAGDAVVADFQLYASNGGKPALWLVAAAKQETAVVGALAMSVSIEALNAITTASGDWESVGLKGGESYVVGPDGTLFSESRLWLEDPDSFLKKLDDDEQRSLVETLGSPVGVVAVDTEAARAASDGETFVGATKNYLGQDTFAYASKISIGTSEWVVVAELPIDEIRAPLWDYIVRLLIVLAIVLPLAALIGYVLADRLTRSIPPLVKTASAIAAGARDVQPPALGANEFGDLSRRLEQMATELGRQEIELAAEFEQRRDLLLSVLPPRLVRGEGEVGGTGESFDTATVISVDVTVEGAAIDASDLLRRFGQAAEESAADRSIDRVRSSADRLLFLAGVDHGDDGADEAIDLALELSAITESLVESDDENEVAVHIGISTGPVATGVLERGSLTFTVWGEPVRRALAIGALSTSNEILIDESTAVAVTNRQRIIPASEIIALDGQTMSLFAPAAPA